jgi:beta-1,4-N-acetylglucosaminyltransferase
MMRVGLICSSGGHLALLYRLRPWWAAVDRFWVCFDKPDSRERLEGERVYWASSPTTRNLRALWRNGVLARRILSEERPDVLVSSGAGVALPFFAYARFLGVPLVYVEVPDRVEGPSLTGRLLYPWVDRMVLTDARQSAFYPDGVTLGDVR